MAEKKTSKGLLRRAFLASLLAFSAGARADAGAGIEAEETYWKTTIVDTVIALRACPETGICGRIVWFNPDDRALRYYFGDPAVKRKDAPALHRMFCQFSPRMDVEKVSPVQWKGKMEARGLRSTLDFDAGLSGADKIDIKLSKSILSRRDSWTRVAPDDPRYPHCAP